MPKIRDKDGKLRDIQKLQGNFPDWTITCQDVGAAGTEQDLRRILTAIFGQPGLIISELIVQGICASSNDLNLRGITSKSSLRLHDCSFRKLQLADASLRSLYVIGGKIGEIEGTRLKLSGSFDMSPYENEPTDPRGGAKSLPTCIDYLELSGAEIGGNLDLENVTILGKSPSDIFPNKAERFSAKERLALRADGIKVRGNLFLRGLEARGGLRINGCDIGRNVDLQRTQLKNDDGYALSIAGGEIKGDLSFRVFPKESSETSSPQDGGKVSIAKSTIRLNNSKIVGRVYLSDLCVEVATGSTDADWGRYGIEAEGLEIGATLHTDNLTLNAPLNLVDAILKGGWIGRDMRLRTGAMPALIATGIEVAGLADLEALFTDSYLMCVRAEFRGGLLMKKVNFQPCGKTCNRPSSAECDRPSVLAIDVSELYPTLNNWRKFSCGLNLDRATVLGSFELDALVLRSDKPPEARCPRHGPDRDKVLDRLKRCWPGAQTWLCLDGAMIPEIDKEAFDSFKEFDFVDLMNCTYRSVVTRESDRDAWRTGVKTIVPLGGVTELLRQKREKLRHVIADFTGRPPPLHPFLDTPDVEAWLKVLDAEYAPLLARRDNAAPGSGRLPLPRWAQDFGLLRLFASVLSNVLLVLSSRYPKTLLFVFTLFVLAVWNRASGRLGRLLFFGFLIISLAVLVAVAKVCLKSAAGRLGRQPDQAGPFRRAAAWFTGIGRGPYFNTNVNYLLRHDYRYYARNGDRANTLPLEVPVFHPQPYLQLARTMRDAGFDRDAAEVIIAMEWRRTWYGGLSLGQKALQFVKGWFLEFGFNRMRPIKYQLVVIVASTLVFQLGYFEGAIVPAKSNEGDAPQTELMRCPATISGKALVCRLEEAKTPNATPKADPTHSDARGYVRFNALLFAAETILPLTDFGQRKNWIVEPVAGDQQEIQDMKSPMKWYYAFSRHNLRKTFYFHLIALWALLVTAFGSLMTTLFVAGILGVITPKY